MLCLNFALFTVPTANASDWLVSSWDSRISITIDAGDINTDLTDFPVFVYLDNTIVNWSLIQDNLNDIRFTDSDTTLLSFEIDNYVVNDEAFIWVKIPLIDDTINTVFYMYYNNPLITESGEDAENVYNANYMMVHHLKDTTTATVTDSTTNDNDGIKKGVNEPIETTGGIIDNAQDFDGTDDYIVISDDATLNFGGATDFTLSTWYKSNDKTDYNYLVFKGDIQVGSENYFIRTQITTGYFYAVIDGDTGNTAVEGTINICDNSFHKLDAVYDRDGDLTLYTDGLPNGTPADISGVGNVDNNDDMRFSSRLNNGAWAYFCIGILDETRISDRAQSSSWIFASYETQRGHLLTYGAPSLLELITMAVEISTLSFIFGIIGVVAFVLVILKK